MEMEKICQEYDMYRDEDHRTWALLMARQNKLSADIISEEYLEGYRKLELDDKKISKIEDLSVRLEYIAGWTLTPVKGLIPVKDFFYMLSNKKYPITTAIRQPWEIDFSEQPDIFHDICGHLPLLINDKFTEFLTAYSMTALKYVDDSRALDLLGRLYWYTYEMGVIAEHGKLKPYGGAVITSSQELMNMSKATAPIHPFNLGKIFRTPYDPFKLQVEYFYINSFDDLFQSLSTVETDLFMCLESMEANIV